MAKLSASEIYGGCAKWLMRIQEDQPVDITALSHWLASLSPSDKDTQSILCAGFDELIQTQGHANPHFSLSFHQDHNPGLTLADYYKNRSRLNALPLRCLMLLIEAGLQGPLATLSAEPKKMQEALLALDKQKPDQSQHRPHRLALLCLSAIFTLWFSIFLFTAISSLSLDNTLKQLTVQAKTL